MSNEVNKIVTHLVVTCDAEAVPRAGPSVHKTGVISDSRPGPLLINDDVIVPQVT